MEKLKPCPFCGTKVEMEKMPLWDRGGHGYQDCYKFVVTCKKCGCTLKYMYSDTIYCNEEDAINNVIDAWNTRKNKIAGIPQQKTGHWIEHPHEAGENWEYSRYECSECHIWEDDDSDYCPNCGAKMEVDK